MTELDFRDLCRDISAAVGKQDVDALAETGRIEIDSVDFALFFDETAIPNTLFCYADLGDINVDKRAEVYEHLLHLNLVTGSKTNAVFALDPLSGKGVLVAHLAAAKKPDAEKLLQTLRLYALQATHMREFMRSGEVPAAKVDGAHSPAELA